jgi:heptosyltransferase-2
LTSPGNILVFHTAFPGDIVLTLPLVQALHRQLPGVRITVVTTPGAANVLTGHPAVDATIEFDKRGVHQGLRGILFMSSLLRERRFDTALIPHRSFRSGLVCRLAGIPRRIGFSTSAARFLMTRTVPYVSSQHEILRNLALAGPLGIELRTLELPAVFPSQEDRERVDAILESAPGEIAKRVALAPGSVWNTKCWPEARFSALAGMLRHEGYEVVLVGGESDAMLCERIAGASAPGGVRLLNACGKLTLLQSAALIERCTVLVSNDSAPMHLGVAVRTPVVAIFGPTVPAFGFGPAGEHDRVVEIRNLSCRPCAIHGGPACPVGTFDCMNDISAGAVRDEIHALIRLRTKSGTKKDGI